MADTNEIPDPDDVAPLVDDKQKSSDEIAAATEKVEQAKQISREAFATGVRRILNLSIEGYPRALRSTRARRNELLRKHHGNQDDAVDDIKAQAADTKEELKTWALGMVPYIGLPTSVLYPTWRAMRRCCLLASCYGFDLSTEETRAKILHVFCGMRAVPVGEYALETAVQMVWSALVGPAAKFVPVGVLASKVANVEGHVMGVVGHETFTEGRQLVLPEEYEQELDREPTHEDRLGLLRDSAFYSLLLGRDAGIRAFDVVKDKERREATAVAAANLATGAVGVAAGTALTFSKAAMAVATDPKTPGKAADAATDAAAKARDLGAKGFSMVGSMLGGSKKA